MRLPACCDLINLTPHTVVFAWFCEGQNSIEPSGIVARVETNQEYIGFSEAGPLGHQPMAFYTESVGEVTDLPEAVEGRYYIVSRFVAQACPDRVDLVVPTDLRRDDKGRIIGAGGLTFIR